MESPETTSLKRESSLKMGLRTRVNLRIICFMMKVNRPQKITSSKEFTIMGKE